METVQLLESQNIEPFARITGGKEGASKHQGGESQ